MRSLQVSRAHGHCGQYQQNQKEDETSEITDLGDTIYRDLIWKTSKKRWKQQQNENAEVSDPEKTILTKLYPEL